MAQGPVLLSIQFVEDCLKRNKLLQAEDYPLQDVDGENRYCLKLPEAIERAKANKGQLLLNQPVYVTENIFGGFDTYQSIAEANGGKCILYKGRASPIVMRVGAGSDDSEEEERDYVYLVSGDTTSEVKLWPKFCQMARDAGRIPRIVKTDWMLDLALSQRLRWDNSYEMTGNEIRNDT